jgi:regulator of sirC expression with transglutaminase-like and TPR domain
VTAPASSARQRFTREVRLADGDLDLARVALLVAQEQYPQLPIEMYLARLDSLAEEVRGRLGQETAPLLVLEELTRTLYERHRFRGNTEAYYDPRNSFLNDVLDRRTGIPLTLGIVLLEVGWRLGLTLEGVAFPHHFLVRYRGAGLDLLLDPFQGGEARFEHEAQDLLDRVYGGMVRVQPSFLRTASRRDMLIRLLNNLKSIYLNTGDEGKALGVVERILLLRPDAAPERRTLGVLLARMGRREEALEELRRYLESGPETRERARIEEMVRSLEAGESAGEEIEP